MNCVVLNISVQHDTTIIPIHFSSSLNLKIKVLHRILELGKTLSTTTILFYRLGLCGPEKLNCPKLSRSLGPESESET